MVGRNYKTSCVYVDIIDLVDVLPNFLRGSHPASSVLTSNTNYSLDSTFIEDKVDRTLWWHYLTVVIPDNIVYPDVGCLYVTGGSNRDE